MMTDDLVPHRMPWEPAPLTETVALIQRDLATMVACTAVLVRSERPELRMVVNTPRGQIIPRGVCNFSDGSTTEFQDLGMPQPGAEMMLIGELMARVWDRAQELGLELRL